jgi:hypothetical protein
VPDNVRLTNQIVFPEVFSIASLCIKMLPVVENIFRHLDKESASKTTGDCFHLVFIYSIQQMSFKRPRNFVDVELICFK